VATTGKLVVITGPSGAGKSTVVEKVRAHTDVAYSVSATTRSPREGEVDGRDYQFVSRQAFEAMIAADELLEWATVFGGEYYGTPAAPVAQAIAAGKAMILEIDIQGGLQVASRMPEAMFVLLLPPDEATLRQRLAGRGTEGMTALEERLAKANEEIRTARDSGVYNIEVVNDDLATTVQQVVALINEV
jgi:guanylate kinase